MLFFGRFAPLLLLVLFTVGCAHRAPVTVLRGFYYWKSNQWSMDVEERDALKHLKAGKLYVKMFEVTKDTLLGIVPSSKTTLNYWHNDHDSTADDPQIVPTIFIRNEALLQITAKDVDTLAANILFLINKYRTNFHYMHQEAAFSELQIDCDWTAATRDAYFGLLRSLKKRSGKKLTCTLRLYPYKYREKLGVPPVDRAMLMCYNLVNPLASERENSILNLAELKAYLGRKSDYPLALDIALPLYSWFQLYQNDRFTKVFYSAEEDMTGILKPLKPLWFEVKKDTVIGDTYLRAGDLMKYENVTPEVLHQVIETLKERVPLSDSTTIAFFHLDKKLLTEYNNETLDSLYNSFSR